MVQESGKEIKKLLEREAMARGICAELNNFVNLESALTTVLRSIKSFTSCESVAVRLHMDGDYPYYVWDGFSDSFIQRESSICQKDNSGGRIADANGKGYLLECMCGNIIRGRFNPCLPFFTEGGSFWSNNTSALFVSATDEDRQSKTRNYCNSCGYESVALIPIKAQSQIIGLLQLNDRRKNMFVLDLIEHLEMVCAQIGLAVRNAALYSKLKKTLEETIILRGLLPICSYCKRIRDGDGCWHQIESYLTKYSEMQFTHGLCPACSRRYYPEMKLATNHDLDFIVDLASPKAHEGAPSDHPGDADNPRR